MQNNAVIVARLSILGLLLCSLVLGYEANPLHRSLSLKQRTSSDNHELPSSLVNGPHEDPLPLSKPNKVSKVLHFLHSKSREAIFNPNMRLRAQTPGQDIPLRNWEGKTDDEILNHACDTRPTKSCIGALKLVSKMDQETKAQIAQSIRSKPDYVDTNRLVYLKLLETGITKAEKKGYDEKLNTVIDSAIKNPYAFAAVKALDLAMKTNKMISN